jgi:nucleoside-diphosphate-sugar epimerase
MMKSALVIGGSSFIGGHLCKALVSRGVAVVRTALPDEDLPNAVTCDLLDRSRLAEIVTTTEPDWIFQCAGATQTTDPHALYALHVGGTLNLLDVVAHDAQHASILLFGSAAEYGAVPENALPVGEDFQAQPLTFFGASKLAQTDLARACAAQWQLRIVSVRPFNAIGPGLPKHYFVGALIQRLLETQHSIDGSNVPIVNADATRDFVDVRDIVAAILALTEPHITRRGSLEIFNIASGEEVRLMDVARKLCNVAGGLHPITAGAGSSRSGIARSCGDASRLRQLTGWAPKISWQQSVEDMWTTTLGHCA